MPIVLLGEEDGYSLSIHTQLLASVPIDCHVQACEFFHNYEDQRSPQADKQYKCKPP